MGIEEDKLIIKNIDDLLRCTNLASLLEVSGTPKPGNIHRTEDFEDTRFEHFMAAIAAIQPNFKNFCERIYNYRFNIEDNCSFIGLGKFIEGAVKEMMIWQKGGNVLLGHILILAPLAASAAICLKLNRTTYKDFKFTLFKIINESTVEDTIALYEAIKISNPGGLGKIDKYDINDKNAIKDILNDKITLKKIFELSKDYDLISLEYATGFNIILNEGLPYYIKTFYETSDVNTTTVNTFLKILTEHPDTLITRKSGFEAALMVSSKASEIMKKGGISDQEGLKLCYELDNLLQSKKGKLNPGTTADIMVGIIFCALIFELRF